MNIGEKIFSNNTKQTYTVFQTLKAGGQSEVCFATSDKSKKIFFIKRFRGYIQRSVGSKPGHN